MKERQNRDIVEEDFQRDYTDSIREGLGRGLRTVGRGIVSTVMFPYSLFVALNSMCGYSPSKRFEDL